jgi:hypothetical protein
MPRGSHKYFENLEPYGKPLKPGHPEFEAQIRARIGNPFVQLVDEEAAGYIGPDDLALSLRGFQVDPGQEGALEAYGRRLARAGAEVPEDANRPGVYGVGRGATPATWAHEFRHERISSESTNRLNDVVYAPSLQAYQQAVRSAYSSFAGDGKVEANVSFPEKERFVLDKISYYQASDSSPMFGKIKREMEPGKGRLGRVWGYVRGKMGEPDPADVARAEYPFLMWMGRDANPPLPKYKTSGGSVPLSSLEEEYEGENPLRSLGMEQFRK